jgi:hypothetical protein
MTDTTTEPPSTYFARLFDPRVRGYLVTVVAALAVVFVALFQKGELIAAVVPLLLAVAGLALRWTGVPLLVVMMVCYLLVFPMGVPVHGYSYAFVPSSYFLLTDLLFVPAVLCYVAAQYRLFGLTERAAPADRRRRLDSNSGPLPRRPAGAIGETELQWLFAGIAVAVLCGQLLWLAFTKLEFDLGRFPPVRAADRSLASPASRFFLFAVGFGLTAGVVRFAFWCLRLYRLTPAEARAIVVDTGWEEIRRESARQETWRAWGRPGARRGDGISFWAGLRAPFVSLLALAAIALVLRIIWEMFQIPKG